MVDSVSRDWLKRCPGCGQVKDRSEFSTDPTTSSGVSSHCKKCKAFEAAQRKRDEKGLPRLPDDRKFEGQRSFLPSSIKPKQPDMNALLEAPKIEKKGLITIEDVAFAQFIRRLFYDFEGRGDDVDLPLQAVIASWREKIERDALEGKSI